MDVEGLDVGLALDADRLGDRSDLLGGERVVVLWVSQTSVTLLPHRSSSPQWNTLPGPPRTSWLEAHLLMTSSYCSSVMP